MDDFKYSIEGKGSSIVETKTLGAGINPIHVRTGINLISDLKSLDSPDILGANLNIQPTKESLFEAEIKIAEAKITAFLNLIDRQDLIPFISHFLNESKFLGNIGSATFSFLSSSVDQKAALLFNPDGIDALTTNRIVIGLIHETIHALSFNQNIRQSYEIGLDVTVDEKNNRIVKPTKIKFAVLENTRMVGVSVDVFRNYSISGIKLLIWNLFKESMDECNNPEECLKYIADAQSQTGNIYKDATEIFDEFSKGMERLYGKNWYAKVKGIKDIFDFDKVNKTLSIKDKSRVDEDLIYLEFNETSTEFLARMLSLNNLENPASSDIKTIEKYGVYIGYISIYNLTSICLLLDPQSRVEFVKVVFLQLQKGDMSILLDFLNNKVINAANQSRYLDNQIQPATTTDILEDGFCRILTQLRSESMLKMNALKAKYFIKPGVYKL